MTEEEHKEDKEQMINLTNILINQKKDILNEVRRDFREFAFRLFSVELSVYGLVKEKRDITDEEKKNILMQNDILIANVETMLSRLKEIDTKEVKG